MSETDTGSILQVHLHTTSIYLNGTCVLSHIAIQSIHHSQVALITLGLFKVPGKNVDVPLRSYTGPLITEMGISCFLKVAKYT